MTSHAHRLDCAAFALLGPRDFQNDTYRFDTSGRDVTYALLADGAGSDPEARTAADAACAVYADLLQEPPGHLSDALLSAPDQVGSYFRDHSIRSSTTVVGVAVEHSGTGWIWSHGDSTIVRFRAGIPESANRLHNKAALDEMLHRPPDPLGPSILTRSLSRSPKGTSDLELFAPAANDTIVLMSDGAVDLTPLPDITDVVGHGEASADDMIAALQELLQRRKAASHERDLPIVDNATWVFAKVVDLP